MTGYKEFQQIMAELERKKKISEGMFNLPPEFENLFNGFNK